MIITKTPMRISLFGGGTDLPEFYSRHGGAVISCAIDSYVYVTLHPSFSGNFRISYSEIEESESPTMIKHPIVREALKASNQVDPLEITTIADIPSTGSGLGSSSAFSVGLLNALYAHNSEMKTGHELAELAFQLERYGVGDAVGKQDHYGCALGSWKLIEFPVSGPVRILKLSNKVNLAQLTDNLILFYTGITRSASNLLTAQIKSIENGKTVNLYRQMQDITNLAFEAITSKDFERVGLLLREAWELKRKFYPGISSGTLDQMVEAGIGAGALGAKLLGAGGGGFLLFYVEKERRSQVKKALIQLKEVKFRVDDLGSRIVFEE